jgi:hypothetical protein
VPVVLALTFTLSLLFTRVASPFVLAPALICGALAAITSIPAIAERPWLVMSWAFVTAVAPFAGEWLGLVPATWEVTSRGLLITADLVSGHGHDMALALVTTHVLFMLVFGWLALTISRRRLTAQRQLYVQAWHLGQLVPTPATGIPRTGHGRLRTGPL